MPKPEVLVLKDPSSVAHAGAERVRAAAHDAATQRGAFHWVLSGGSTPRALYGLLAEPNALPWRATHIYFGDERHVPPSHPDSNYHMAHEALLRQPFVAMDRVARVEAELTAAEAARRYERTLRDVFVNATWPAFDLVLLGLGTDGHTASLFPRTSALDERERWVVDNPVPQLATERITLTYPALNAARQIVFLVAGADKAQPLRALLDGHVGVRDLPSRGIAPAHGELVFLVDEAAAALLG